MKQRCPEIAGTVEHLRDIDPAKLGYPTSDVYRWLLRVPETMTRNDFRVDALPGAPAAAGERTSPRTPSRRAYHPRGVLLYGIAEILRSRMCVDLLEAGRVEEFGRLMKISHDGDRVSRPGPDGSYQRVAGDCGDEYIQRLIADLGSENPQRVLRAQLFMQPGGYACSTPEIDQMVDIAAAVPGVAGAQIAGAGLGGCIMVLVRHESVAALRKALARATIVPASWNRRPSPAWRSKARDWRNSRSGRLCLSLTPPFVTNCAGGRRPRRGRSDLGRASFTVIDRPSISRRFNSGSHWPLPCRRPFAKPKPRGRPVSCSLTMLTSETFPYWANACLNSSSVALCDRLPT